MPENEKWGISRSGRGEPGVPTMPQGEAVPRACPGVDELLGLSEPQARGFVDCKVATENSVLPLQVVFIKNHRMIRVAATEDTHELRQRIVFAAGMPVELVVVEANSLREAIYRAYLGDEERFISSANTLMRYGKTLDPQREISTGSVAETSEVVRFVNCLIEYAIAHKASDIHIGARREGSFVQLRVAGELREHREALSNLAAHQQLASRIKVMAQLDITGRDLPQDGRMQYRFGTRLVDIRVSIIPTVHGENIVMRLFGLEKITALEELGLHSGILEEIACCLHRCSGALMIAGPTGSGKTSTLYAIVDRLRGRHAISTIEDPVEISIDGIAQTGVQESSGFGFAEALRSVLRQDPDVILIGEMREQRTAIAVFDAALSGHLVLSTVHGGSVMDGLLRLEHLGVARPLIAQALNFLMVQRLVKRLCPECRVFDLRAANSIGCDVFRPVGCSRCNYSGYSGLILIAEALTFSEQVREFIRRTDLLSAASLAEAAGSSFWQFREQLLFNLERGDISYSQYLEMV